MKGISEIFSSLIVLLITIALIGPLLIYVTQVNNSANSSISSSYRAIVKASMIKLEIIRLNGSTSGWFMYNLSPNPLLVNGVIIDGHYYPVNRVINGSELVNFAQLTGIKTNASGESIYLMVNGTLIQT